MIPKVDVGVTSHYSLPRASVLIFILLEILTFEPQVRTHPHQAGFLSLIMRAIHL